MSEHVQDGAGENMSLLTAFMTERRYFDNAIFTTVTGILAATGTLFGILHFVGAAKVGKLIPIIGILSVLISMYAVRMYRNRLDKSEHDGYITQEFLKQHVQLAVTPFGPPEETQGMRFSTPDMVHYAVFLVWLGMLSLHIPAIDAQVDKITKLIFG